MKIATIVLTLSLVIGSFVLSGCSSGGYSSSVPTQRIIIKQEDSWADTLRAQREAYDSMHKRSMENRKALKESLDNFLGTAGRGVSFMGRQTKSYMRRRR